jgi:hypothetical protein
LKKRLAIFATLFVFAAAGLAQVPTAGNIFLGYSYANGSTGDTNSGSLNGWEASVEGRIFPFVGLVADYSQNSGTLGLNSIAGNSSTRVQSYLFGPRVSAKAGKVRPFAEVLIGGAHLHQTSTTAFALNTDTCVAFSVGGGIDYSIAPHIAWRTQLGDLQTRFYSGTQNELRLSTGLALRF